MATSPLLRTGIAALALLAGAACSQIENPRTMLPTEPGVDATRSKELHRAQYEDLPVPPGFEYVTRGNRSFSYLDGGVKVGRFLYWGRTSVEETAAFYRRTLPLRAYGWDFLSEESLPKRHELRFRKADQECTVTLTRDVDATYAGVTIIGRY
jgi:hypothetical protein